MLKNIDEIKKFEEYLTKYETNETKYSIKYLSLTKWFAVVSHKGGDNKAFAALLDIKLSLSHVYRDMQTMRSVWNNNFRRSF